MWTVVPVPVLNDFHDMLDMKIWGLHVAGPITPCTPAWLQQRKIKGAHQRQAYRRRSCRGPETMRGSLECQSSDQAAIEGPLILVLTDALRVSMSAFEELGVLPELIAAVEELGWQ